MGELSPILIWFLVGLVFIGVEFLAPGVISIFFGVGAWATAMLFWIFPSMGLTVQLALFLIFSILSLVILRKTIAKKFFKDSEKGESDLDIDYIGEEASVVEIILPEDDGIVSFHGTNWKARSSHVIEVGASVVITNQTGLTLHVVPKNLHV